MASVTQRPDVPAGVIAGGVVAIGRRLPRGRVEAIADGLVTGGVGAFELTLNDPEDDALQAIAAVARHVEGGPLVVGAGTVLTTQAAERAIEAGARFLVMPHTDPALIAWAAERGVPTFPGALSPTEVLAAWRAGAAAVKLFPASVAGPNAVRELRGPFPDIPLIPTGGVTADSAAAFMRAGAIAVGIGSWLTGGADPAAVAERAALVVRAVADARAVDAST